MPWRHRWPSDGEWPGGLAEAAGGGGGGGGKAEDAEDAEVAGGGGGGGGKAEDAEVAAEDAEVAGGGGGKAEEDASASSLTAACSPASAVAYISYNIRNR